MLIVLRLLNCLIQNHVFPSPDYPGYDWLYDSKNCSAYQYAKPEFNSTIIFSNRDIEDWEALVHVKSTYLNAVESKGLSPEWINFYFHFDTFSLEGPKWLQDEVQPFLNLKTK